MAPARKIMVVADPSRESAGALQYALSHVVVENDELILLHVRNPSSSWSSFSFLKRSSFPATPMSNSCSLGVGEKDGFLEALKQICEVAHPKVRVRLETTQLREEARDKDKADTILAKSNLLGVNLLIIGQRRSFSTAILGYKLSGGSGMKGFDTTEYLIEKSKCTCVAVQRRGQNAGYILNTKTHKNFWLLA